MLFIGVLKKLILNRTANDTSLNGLVASKSPIDT